MKINQKITNSIVKGEVKQNSEVNNNVEKINQEIDNVEVQIINQIIEQIDNYLLVTPNTEINEESNGKKSLKYKLQALKIEIEKKQATQSDLGVVALPDFSKLNFDSKFLELLKNRWNEVQLCINHGACLSAVIMMGSILEGILLGLMEKYPNTASHAVNAPKKEGRTKSFNEWSLSNMIDVAHEITWIQLDVKKFSHVLRDFRNLVHPKVQLNLGTYPDIDTCKISWLVVQAACNDIKKWVDKTVI